MLGGKPAIRGTRLSASLILACLAEGMSAEEIEASYGPFPHDAIPEVLKAASGFDCLLTRDRLFEQSVARTLKAILAFQS